MKHCSSCDISKEDSAFHKDKSKPDGLYYKCKACVNSAYTPIKKKLKECEYCGKEFKGSGNAKYCNSKCLYKAQYEKGKGSYEFICKGCGETAFAVSKQRTNYCTHGCYLENKPNDWREHEKECVTCGDTYTAKSSASLYCSDECNPINWKSVSISFNECVVCESTFVAKYSNESTCSDDCNESKYEVLAKRKWENKPKRKCKNCSKPFQPRYKGLKRYCSTECKVEYRRWFARQTESHYARSKFYGVYYENVNRLKVFDRDNYICQGCKCKTDRSLVGKNTNKDNEPTLDHIIPISLGGSHSYGNVQTLCRKCNTNKGATTEGQSVMDLHTPPGTRPFLNN